MVGAKPRIVRAGPQRKPVYLFTDGSCDPDLDSPAGLNAGYGAVLWDPEDNALEIFGADVGDDMLEVLTGDVFKKQIVEQSELLRSFAAKTVWKTVER